MSNNPDRFRHLDERDPSASLVEEMLNTLRSTDQDVRFSQVDWHTLQQQRPNLHHFIDAISQEAAPRSPLIRSRIAGALMGMILLQETMRLDMAADALLPELEHSIDPIIPTLYNA